MRRNRLAVWVAAVSLLGGITWAPRAARAAGAQAGAPGSAGCDRACLEGFVDRFLDALAAHDPSRLPTTKLVRFTENGQTLELGDGIWRTITAKGTYKFYVADTQAGQVGFEGTMREAGQPIIIAVRLKIESQKVSEIEMIVARGNMAQNGARWWKPYRRPSASRASSSSRRRTSIFPGCSRTMARPTIRSSPTTATAWRTACRPPTT